MNRNFGITRTFGPTKTVFYEDYEAWAKVAKAKGWYLAGASGSIVAQDANGTCRGYWNYNLKKGWMDK